MVFCFYNYSFIFLPTVSLLCSIFQNNISSIFLRFGLMDIDLLGCLCHGKSVFLLQSRQIMLLILDWLSLSFRILDALFQALWLSVSFEKSSVILMGFPVYVMCYFQSFQYTIFVTYSYIIVIICGDFI